MAWYDQLITDLKAGFAAVATDYKAIFPRLVPAGGLAGQVLAKKTNSDYDLVWTNATSGGGGVAYQTVVNYSAMIALGTPATLTFVLVSQDTKVSAVNTTYQLWPNGIRRLLSSTSDNPPIDYSGMGTVIHDGGGSFQNDSSRSPDNVFDGNTSTFYDAINNGAGKYVGRNLGSARMINRVLIMPRQDATYGSQINNGQLQYSTDGSTWTTLYTVTGVTNTNYTQLITANFAPTTAQYWRLYWPNTGSFGNVSEIQLQYTN